MTCAICNQLPCVCGKSRIQRLISRAKWQIGRRNWKPKWQFHRKYPKFMTGQAVGKAFCKILGENPDNVQMITIHLEAGAVATVYITRFLSTGEKDKILAQIKEYKLVPSSGATTELGTPTEDEKARDIRLASIISKERTHLE